MVGRNNQEQAMAGQPAKFPYLEHDGILAFAHRGGVEAGPENTLVAFEAAVRLGYRYVETDVHCTRDGVLIAFHDSVLDRVTDRRGRIAELEYRAVREARVGGTEPIPLLEDLLGSWPQLRVNIDPKHDDAVAPLATTIRRMGAIDRVCVGSFSGARLDRIRGLLGPGLCTSMGPREVTRLWFGKFGLPTGNFVAGCAQVPVRHYGLPVVDRRFVRTAEQLGLQVHVWTVDAADEMHRLLDLGVTGLMTDHPTVLKQVLEARGTWH